MMLKKKNKYCRFNGQLFVIFFAKILLIICSLIVKIGGELYTILTNKSSKGRKGTIIAMFSGTKSETVIAVIEKIPLKQRSLVKEITLDMAGNMGLIARKCFPNASRVTDRFHV